MAVKTEKDLPENERALWLKALSAMELRNHGYAISLLQAVLKAVPEFIDARKMLRKAEIVTSKGKKSFLSGLSTASMKSGGVLKKDPLAAIEMAEKMLETDPYGSAGNTLLKDAAKAAGFPEVAAFALETVVEGNPKDTKALHELGAYYYENGESSKAVDIYNRIVELVPSDLIAIKRGKDAAARDTMKSGGWETAKDYRDLIKDKDVAVSLEQQNRVVKSEDMIDQQLAELGQQYEQNPQSVDVSRRIAALYEQKDDLENALTWYKYTSDLTKNTDPSIARKASDLGMKILEKQISDTEEWLAQYSDSDQAPQVRQQLDDLNKQKAGLLISEAKKRVERNPTDLQYRYELGEQLVAIGQFTEAIPELQKARQHANVRLKAMNLLAQCYKGKGMLDFAVRTFTEAIKEMLVMDATKKEMLYKLGLVYEEMGNKEKSIECMKEIYDIDYGYQDVAKRVEESYTA